jgi:uncharacterized protein YdeI (YjbR/CyaY-like superfamily)
MTQHKNLPVYEFTTLDEWLKWLEQNHTDYTSGIWAKIAKKSSGIATARYDDIREGALCYGWIDSLPNKLDDKYYLLKVTPRRPRSVWSRINVELCKEYIADGRMKPSGLIEVEAAIADGRWDIAYKTGEKPFRVKSTKQ